MTKELRRERADQLAAYMRAHSKNFDMLEVIRIDDKMSWAPSDNSVANIKRRIDENWCGTTCCIAGYAVCLFGEPTDHINMPKAAELLGLSGHCYEGIAGMLFVPAYKMQLAEQGFPRDHHMGNTDVEIAIEALYNAVRLREELEEQGLGE
jgi:hypothetical protein